MDNDVLDSRQKQHFVEKNVMHKSKRMKTQNSALQNSKPKIIPIQLYSRPVYVEFSIFSKISRPLI